MITCPSRPRTAVVGIPPLYSLTAPNSRPAALPSRCTLRPNAVATKVSAVASTTMEQSWCPRAVQLKRIHAPYVPGELWFGQTHRHGRSRCLQSGRFHCATGERPRVSPCSRSYEGREPSWSLMNDLHSHTCVCATFRDDTMSRVPPTL